MPVPLLLDVVPLDDELEDPMGTPAAALAAANCEPCAVPCAVDVRSASLCIASYHAGVYIAYSCPLIICVFPNPAIILSLYL